MLNFTLNETFFKKRFQNVPKCSKESSKKSLGRHGDARSQLIELHVFFDEFHLGQDCEVQTQTKVKTAKTQPHLEAIEDLDPQSFHIRVSVCRKSPGKDKRMVNGRMVKIFDEIFDSFDSFDA